MNDVTLRRNMNYASSVGMYKQGVRFERELQSQQNKLRRLKNFQQLDLS